MQATTKEAKRMLKVGDGGMWGRNLLLLHAN